MDVRRKLSASFDPNVPLRLFLWGPETKQLLTAKEESELIIQVQVHFAILPFFLNMEIGNFWSLKGLILGACTPTGFDEISEGEE